MNDKETNEEAIRRLRGIQKQMQDLTQQGLKAFDEQYGKPLREWQAQIEEQRKRQEQQINDDLTDPLRMPVERESDIEFMTDGRPNPTTIRRAISQWKDAQGNLIYTEEGYLPLEQIRTKRNNIVAQQSVWGGMTPDQQTQIETEYKSLGIKSAAAKPFSDYLHSKQLGERFAALKKDPPNPNKKG